MILRRGFAFMALAAALMVTGIVPSTADPGGVTVQQQEVAGLLGYPDSSPMAASCSQALPAKFAVDHVSPATLSPAAALEVAAPSSSTCAGAAPLTASRSTASMLAAAEVGGHRVAAS